ncbi:MAG: ATPase [Aquabacterium sp.]|uniref:ATP-binding protein n=1 Tax=Aquabacterium sp. TaxID=1872578 RepID=UPI0025BEA834|nr:ATP-binding protein [Aquabacterium sp.]MBI5924312.1 ATPase [Aquabacterium sp.]
MPTTDPALNSAQAKSCQPCSGPHQVHELLRANEELKILNAKLSATQDKLVQSEKLASIGQLAAGVAHEINNPIGYIFSNFGTLERYLVHLFQMLSAYEEAERHLSDTPQGLQLKKLREQIELDYLKEDIPNLMQESREGISRVRKIVSDLKDFSRVGASQEWVWANLHRGIESTLNIVNNEIKYKADVAKVFGDIPDVQCLPSEINQVIMNLLINATHAITAERGTITIRTGRTGEGDSEQVWIEVEDNGCGIAKEHISKVFDPFFTTKPVGKGTGLGLSLSYGIVQKHNGHIDVRSEPGQGTCFRISLPVRHHSTEAQE